MNIPPFTAGLITERRIARGCRARTRKTQLATAASPLRINVNTACVLPSCSRADAVATSGCVLPQRGAAFVFGVGSAFRAVRGVTAYGHAVSRCVFAAWQTPTTSGGSNSVVPRATCVPAAPSSFQPFRCLSGVHRSSASRHSLFVVLLYLILPPHIPGWLAYRLNHFMMALLLYSCAVAILPLTFI